MRESDSADHLEEVFGFKRQSFTLRPKERPLRESGFSDEQALFANINTNHIVARRQVGANWRIAYATADVQDAHDQSFRLPALARTRLRSGCDITLLGAGNRLLNRVNIGSYISAISSGVNSRRNYLAHAEPCLMAQTIVPSVRILKVLDSCLFDGFHWNIAGRPGASPTDNHIVIENGIGDAMVENALRVITGACTVFRSCPAANDLPGTCGKQAVNDADVFEFLLPIHDRK